MGLVQGVGVGRDRVLQGCAALALMLVVAGCVPAGGHPAVPAVRTEQVPPPPPTRVVVIWQPGHWDWTGQDYAWVPGLWVERAGHGTLWQDGYWAATAVRDNWVPAHWL